jgi:hypothetical protein
MKPRTGLAITAIVAAGLPLLEGVEDRECKKPPCADETFAKVPDQSHSHEEAPTVEEAGEMYVMNAGSPVTATKVGSQEYNELLVSYPDFLVNNPPFRIPRRS